MKRMNYFYTSTLKGLIFENPSKWNRTVPFKFDPWYRHPREMKSRLIKDLSLLGRDLSKVIIVDNNLDAFHCHPSDGIQIDP